MTSESSYSYVQEQQWGAGLYTVGNMTNWENFYNRALKLIQNAHQVSFNKIVLFKNGSAW